MLQICSLKIQNFKINQHIKHTKFSHPKSKIISKYNQTPAEASKSNFQNPALPIQQDDHQQNDSTLGCSKISSPSSKITNSIVPPT
jgi:hypothetical protein